VARLDVCEESRSRTCGMFCTGPNAFAYGFFLRRINATRTSEGRYRSLQSPFEYTHTDSAYTHCIPILYALKVPNIIIGNSQHRSTASDLRHASPLQSGHKSQYTNNTSKGNGHSTSLLWSSCSLRACRAGSSATRGSRPRASSSSTSSTPCLLR